MFIIEEELKKLPKKPGVYLMKDKDDKIIYVGKAISLKNVRYSQAAVVVFDLTKKASFQKVTDWLKEIRENEPSIPIALFGNKSDLKENRVVDQTDIDKLCESEQLEYFETSAKENVGISEGFAKAASLGYKVFGDVVRGQKISIKKKQKKSCC